MNTSSHNNWSANRLLPACLHCHLQLPRIQKDEQEVSVVVDVISGLSSLLSEKRELMNIPTDDLKNARKIEEKWYACRKNREGTSKKFNNLLKRNKQKTS